MNQLVNRFFPSSTEIGDLFLIKNNGKNVLMPLFLLGLMFLRLFHLNPKKPPTEVDSASC